MINYQSKTKEELIIEIQRLQQEHSSLEGNFNRVINERKQAEKSLRRKEEQMHSIFEAMNEGFTIQEVVCDDEGKPCDLRFIDHGTGGIVYYTVQGCGALADRRRQNAGHDDR